MIGQNSPVAVAVEGAPGAARRATVVAALRSRAEATSAALRRLPAAVSAVEVRTDLAGDPDPRQLRGDVPVQLIYSLRSRRYGGLDAGPAPARRARLLAAARDYDMVDLEADHDLVPEVLAGIPPHQRRICWYGVETELAELRTEFNRMVRVPATLYLLAPRAGSVPAALAPLQLLASLGRNDVTAFGTGAAAGFSRILAPFLGAPVVYGDPAGPTVEQLVTDYRFPDLPRLEGIYGFVGRSPQARYLRLMNAALRELAMPSLFVPFVVPHPADFEAGLWPAIAAGAFAELGLPLGGLTVARPHKPAAFAAAAVADPDAQAARAANFLVREAMPGTPGAQWRAVIANGSTVLAALLDRGPVAGVPVAVVGCGAAGRAAAFVLSGAGARVTLASRGASRGKRAASELGLPYVPLAELRPERYAVLVHATPVFDQIPFALSNLAPEVTVVDFVCASQTSALVAAARRRGLATIDGPELVVQEVRHHFQLATGQPFPVSVDRPEDEVTT